MNSIEVGAEAEQKVFNFMQAQGLTVLARNYRFYQGEIDLIVQEGEVLVFVEVRYRPEFAAAAESIDIFKQRKIEKTAGDYLSKQKKEMPICRFDVVLVNARGELRWLKDAFTASDY